MVPTPPSRSLVLVTAHPASTTLAVPRVRCLPGSRRDHGLSGLNDLHVGVGLTAPRVVREGGSDRWLRLRHQSAMYEHLPSRSRCRVPEPCLCRDELAVPAARDDAFGAMPQTCNCPGLAIAPATAAAAPCRFMAVPRGEA